MRVFTAWCSAAGRCPLPATTETVQAYLTDLIGHGRKITTAERHAVAIHRIHREAKLDSPCGEPVRTLLAGAKRILCQQPNQKDPLQLGHLRKIVETVGTRSPISARNCAIVVFGFATALRRSNLVALTLEDLTFTDEGVLVRVKREKQDRKGKVRVLAVPNGKGPLCPVKILRQWLAWRGEKPGPLFQRVLGGHVNGKPILGTRLGQIVQQCAAAIGLDPKKYGAHSLRSGFVSEALEQEVNEAMICQQTGHASVDTLRIYFRSRNLFAGNAAGRIGL
jgi:site-specific recombinase XerD